MKKPSIPKGTRDFSPTEVVKRNYIVDTIKDCFNTYGFQPIETPSFENSETLMGKYGDEGDRLIFKILNSGDFMRKTAAAIFLSNEFHRNFLNFLSKSVNKEDSKNLNELNLSEYFATKKERNFIKRLILENQTSYLKLCEENETNENVDGLQYALHIAFIKKLNDENFIDTTRLSSQISEKALRYDLTVPFARYVVQHQNEIDFPFKRYQIQPVWRADRPQKGRFREFFQCDADVVGSKSLWQEVEFVQLYDAVFSKLNLENVTIKINNRKVLSGIAEVIGESDKLIDFTVALDKLDKIGEDGVKKEMRDKGISEDAIEKLQPLFQVSGTASEKLELLKELLASSETGMEGVNELEFIVQTITALELQTATLEIDVTLARGLNYYTGAIFEVAAPKEVKMGSIGGGGRYDDLTGIFGLKNMSGVGISFGLDRIYLVLEELGLFPETVSANTKVLFINFGEEEALYAMKAISKLRKEGITAELYPDATKMGKQMGYADKRNIPYTVLAGGNEMQAETYTLKHMKSGEQDSVSFAELRAKLL
ncbi:histidine--tRNA ligase [Marixanthomonas spongiae]|uniref:Histidine--tRNA ligase n=1 Tax=Marixanthomonas spongiae TaxID=2174845 RepID=A0A2U0HYI4_9FLAO|nr:histidine--tRNA ligase [Marixanthomonas spongiae]